MQKAYDKKSELANNASNVESQPTDMKPPARKTGLIARWFKPKPKVVSDDSGLESESTSQTSLSGSLPRSRRDSYNLFILFRNKQEKQERPFIG